MDNVIPLFAETAEPVMATGTLQNILEEYIDFAGAQGVDINSQQFLYECASIMTLMQVAINNK